MIWPYIAVPLAALAVSLVLTPAVIVVARRLNLYDPRGDRKMHTRPVPRIGGIAIVLSMMSVSVTAALLDELLGGPFAEARHQLFLLFATSGLVFLVGVVDDVRGLAARWKLLAQIIAAGILCAAGVRIQNIVLFGLDFGYLGWPITILWIVGITNAINLIDGLDGLSAGIAVATCGVITAFSLFTGQVAMGLLSLALLGSLGGFLVFNFNPARIFMGDSGSMFLGFFLASASLVTATKVATLMGLLLPALAMGLPIFDMLLTVLRRVLDRQSVFAADRGHLHHRLVDSGLKHHHAVILLYVVTLLVTGLAVLMMWLRTGGEVLLVLICLAVLLSVFRIAGVLRFRSMYAQVQRNLARQRVIRAERKEFETLRLRFRAAWTYDQWWRAVRRMARRMGFARVCLRFADEQGQGREELYANPRRADDDRPMMSLTIPVGCFDGGETGSIAIDVPVEESIETIGRRISLFGRLLDEHPPPVRSAEADDSPSTVGREVPAGS